jgi:pimeloyl-ACP methyl ester carboxylesterase
MPRRLRPASTPARGRSAFVTGLPLLVTSIVAGTACAADRLVFEPCTLAAPDLPITIAARCATYPVPLDRTQPDGARIELAVAKIASTAKRPQPDPVFMLAGGPGQSAQTSFPPVASAFRDLLRTRDVILVDQRGTGRSHALHCVSEQGEDDEVSPTPEAWRRAAERCLAELDIDPRFFTTSDAVADLDDVRAALGAAQLNLVGVSYGTRVALEYARRYPAHTRALVLDGVVPPTLALGAEHGRNLEDALDRIFAACSSDADCRSRFPDAKRTLTELLERLRRAPPMVTFRDPLSDAERTERMTAQRVAGVIRLYAYVPTLAAMLPMTLWEAAAGRPERLMAQAAMMESLVGEQLDLGLQLAVTCSEDAPLLERLPPGRETLLGADFVGALVAQCSTWPRGRMPADFHAPLASATPALLLSGELDPVTPPRYGEEVLKGLARGRHLVARGQGHNVMVAGCMPRVIGKFMIDADASRLDVRCLDDLAPTPAFGGAYGWEP